MKSFHNKLIYYPVNTVTDPVAFRLSETCLANPVWPTSLHNLDGIIKTDSMCDSGGLQTSTLGINSDKTVLIGPMLTTSIDDPEFLTIGLLSNCREYKRIESRIAFLVDIPSVSKDSNFAYFVKLTESIKARDSLLELAEYVCPTTELGIVLQPRLPFEIANYFGLISTAKVRLYGYPAGTKPKNGLGNAYVMSFLHSTGVRYFHFMGPQQSR